MSDDRLELPLFDPPKRQSKEELDALFDDTTPPREEDEPMVIETIELTGDSESALEEAETEEFVTEDLSSEAAQVDRGAQPAGIGMRLAAGLIDLLVHAALVGILVGGSSLLDAPVGWRHTMPVAFVGLVFSYVYYVVPLAFWGRTPGMTVAGLRVRTLDDRPLSLPQATKHWLALLLTAATGGLGVLLAVSGRSLADRLSGSQTLEQ